jgi:hypothetical protein
MSEHRYLRAYMAGVAFPVAFLPLLVSVVHLIGFLPREVEWIFLVPLIIVPNGFGLWNMLYVKLHSHWHHPIGLHGAALPFFLGPTAFLLVASQGMVSATGNGLVYLNTLRVPYWYLTFTPFIALAVYYLAWKYVVGFLNRELDLPS